MKKTIPTMTIRQHPSLIDDILNGNAGRVWKACKVILLGMAWTVYVSTVTFLSPLWAPLYGTGRVLDKMDRALKARAARKVAEQKARRAEIMANLNRAMEKL